MNAGPQEERGQPRQAERSVSAMPQEGRSTQQAEGKRLNSVTPFVHAMNAVIWKDLAAELRSREMVSAMLVFALIVIFIYNFALDLNPQVRASLTSGILWVTLAFAGTLGLNRSMGVEKDRGCLDGLLLAPVDRTAIFFGKAISNFVFMLVVAAIILPIYSILYNVSLFNLGLIGVIVLGAWGYVAVGTLLASMAVQARTRDVLLPILLFPIAIPLLVSAVKASSGFLDGSAFADFSLFVNILVAYDVVFTAVAFMVFDSVVEE